MIVGVPKETFPGERRVALVPGVLAPLTRAGLEILIEKGAGAEAGFPDKEFEDKGAKIAGSRADVFAKADCVLQVRTLGANPDAGKADLQLLRKGQYLIGHAEPLMPSEAPRQIAETGALLFAMELMPRITRAQTMDVLSSMATIAGYKAVLIAADTLPRMFPMMTTAAGTVSPAKVFVIGAGVAGLQAIASARRLGAVVEAYDVRAAVKEQIESLGAKFVELPVEAGEAEDKGGYAKELGEEFYRKQRELMAKVVKENDVVITTAAIPGKKSPVLVTADMVKGMRPGSVIVDLAAERGGNCELTKAGETVVEHGVTIYGPLNISATIPYHASQMYAKNLVTFLQHLVKKEAAINLDMDDEITKETLITKDGEVVHERVREVNGLQPATAAAQGRNG